MKKFNRRRVAYIVAVAGLVALVTGCGKGGDAVPPAIGTPGGLYGGNGGCISLAPPGYGGPVGPMSIAFTGSSAYWNAFQLDAGIIPATAPAVCQGGTFGSMSVSVGGATTGQYSDSTPDGSSITMSLSPIGGIVQGGNSCIQNAQPVNVSGSITLSVTQQQSIAYQWFTTWGQGSYSGSQVVPTSPSYYPYTPYQPNYGSYPGYGYNAPVNCAQITGMAIETGFSGTNTLSGSRVFLYINGTNHGVVLYL